MYIFLLRGCTYAKYMFMHNSLYQCGDSCRTVFIKIKTYFDIDIKVKTFFCIFKTNVNSFYTVLIKSKCNLTVINSCFYFIHSPFELFKKHI